MRAKGKAPKKGITAYSEPAKPDTAGLPRLPRGWVWATVDELSTKVVDGVHKKPTYVPSGIPFVTVRNLTAGPGIDFARLNYITLKDHVEFTKRAKPECGDLLISKDGTLGVVRAIQTDMPFSIFVSVALVKPVLHEMKDYLSIALSSPQVQAQMVPKGSGLQHLHLEDLRRDCLPVPPFSEQQRIVADVQRRFSAIDEIESTLDTAQKRTERLRQLILKRAFEGKLVPQDSNDEPACTLLEQIRAERAEQIRAAARKTPARRRLTLDKGEPPEPASTQSPQTK